MKQKVQINSTFAKILFIFSLIITVVVTYIVTKNVIDSDAASELVLAEHLAKTGKILSKDWIYSTELRVFNTQLIFAPLFSAFENWHTVRFLGALILQAILVLSFYIFTRLLDIKRNVFYISSALFLLPVSVCFGRIVLYHSYYVPHIALSLLIVGLTFTKKYNFIKIFMLIVLSFIGGLGGVRHLLMTHAPILFTLFIYWCISDFSATDKNNTFFVKKLPLVLACAFSAGASAFGFIINTNVLAEKYTFADYSKNTINLLSTEKIKDVVYGFLHHFGFRDETEIISVLGVLSVLGIFMAIYCLIIAVKGIIAFKTEQDIAKALPYTFFIAFVTVMLTVFLILDNGYYFVLYFTPLVIWMIPVFVTQFVNKDTALAAFNLKRLLPFLAVAIILINGLVNAAYFTGKGFDQKYEGLKYRNKDRKSQMVAVTEFLETEEYNLGYATFWNANIVTEITNGKVKMINVEVDEQGQVSLYDWLTLKSNHELEDAKKFLLLESSLVDLIEYSNDLGEYEIVYSDEYFVVYNVS